MVASEPIDFDSLLMTLASHPSMKQGGEDPVDALLTTFFSFLRRRTDFFKSRNQETIRESVKQAFERQLKLADQDMAGKKEEDHRRAEEDRKRKARQQEEDRLRWEAVQKSQQENQASPGKIEDLDSPNLDLSENAEDTEDKPAPLNNGGTTDRYIWAQELSSAEARVYIPPGTRAKELGVTYTSNHLKVVLKASNTTLLDADFPETIKPDDLVWTLEDSKFLHITLEKFDAMKWWPCFLKGDPEINTKDIRPASSKLQDLDGETRATVEKMMYDQRQKAVGKPTSDEMKNHELLEKFKMQHPEMDFSNCKFSS